MSYFGDIPLGNTIDFKFTTMDAGIPTSLSGSFAAAYPNNSTAEIVSGITLTVDFDSRTGLNNTRVVASSGNGFSLGDNIDIVLISGTVGGKSVVGYVVGSFSISARNPTGTSGGDPWSTALPGSYTSGQAGYILASRMPTGTVIVGTNNDKTGYSLSTPQSFNMIGNISGTLSNVLNVINPVTAGSVTGSVLGNVNGSVNSVTNPVGISTGTFLDALADKVWDETNSQHLINGSVGQVLFSRMPTGTVFATLSSPQTFDLIGNISGTITNTLNVVNPVVASSVTGNVLGSVNSVVQPVGISTGSFINAIADQVWDEANSDHLVNGSVGQTLASRMPSGTVIVGQNNDKTGYSLSSPQSFNMIGNISGTLSNVLNVVNPVTAGSVTGSVLGNVNGSVNSVVQPVGISTGSFINAVADQVWDETLAQHLQAGSTGFALNGAGSAGDPWQTSLPGTYISGQAGYILASRMPTGTVIVGQNNDKTGYSLSSPQSFNMIGNISGTLSNVLNVVNPIPVVGTVTGSVVVSVNNDKTGYSLLTSEHTSIADALLKRDWTAVTGEASRSVLNALRKLRNKVSYNGTNTLSIKKEDDATNAYTQAINTDANQDPFKEVG